MKVQIPISKGHKIEFVDIEVEDSKKIQVKSGDIIKLLFRGKSINIPYDLNFINLMEYDTSDTYIIEIYKNKKFIDKVNVNPIVALFLTKDLFQDLEY